MSESFWDSEGQAATERFFIVDAKTGEVTRHALTNEAYTDEQFRKLLTKVGFEDIQFLPSLVGLEVEDESQSVNLAVVGRKKSNQALPADA